MLVVLVDGLDRLHAGVVGARLGSLIPVGASLLFVPVVNASDKGRDQLHLGLATSNRLALREQQGQVGVNALLLQLFGRLDAFPGRGDLDQHAVHMHAFGLVELDDALGTGDRGVRVKRQTRIHFGRHAARDDGQNLAAKAHQQAVHDLVQRPAAELLHRLGQQRRVFRLLHRLEDERRIGGRILRLELCQLVEIAGVCHHGGQRFECIELVHGRSLSICAPVHAPTRLRSGHLLGTTDTPCRPKLNPTCAPIGSTCANSGETTKIAPKAVSKLYS